MITDPDELTPLSAFKDSGIVTTDTLNAWRKKDNGIIQTLNELEANSISDQCISFDLNFKTISIKPSSIGSSLINNDSVITSKIINSAVTADKLAANAVTTVKILDSAVTASKLATDSVTTVKILAGNVTNAKMSIDSISTSNIIAGAVTSDKLAANAVTTAKILDGSVTASKLSADSVTTAKILDGAVTASKLATDSVSSIKIAPAAVTNTKLADSSVDSLKIGGANIPRQILSATKSDTQFLDDAAGWTYITGLAKAITIQAGAKIRIQAVINGALLNTVGAMALALTKDGVHIGIGNAAGGRTLCSAGLASPRIDQLATASIDFIDGPLPAGTYTFGVQAILRGSHAYINKFVTVGGGEPNDSNYFRSISTLTLTELS